MLQLLRDVGQFVWNWAVDVGDVGLIVLLATIKSLQDDMAFRRPWEVGWWSITWRWTYGSGQWYKKLAKTLTDWLPGKFDVKLSKHVYYRVNIRLSCYNAVAEFGENVNATISDFWHLLAVIGVVAVSFHAADNSWEAVLNVALFASLFQFLWSGPVKRIKYPATDTGKKEPPKLTSERL